MDTLFVIDLTKGFCEEGKLAAPEIKKVVPYINKFYQSNKDTLQEVLAFADCHTKDSRELEYMPEHGIAEKEQEIIDELAIPFDEVIAKDSTNGFYRFLNLMAKNKNVYYNFINTDTFYITGCLTSYCVLQFALSLKTCLNEYSAVLQTKPRVVVLKDGCADIDNEMEQWALKYMQLNGIEVR